MLIQPKISLPAREVCFPNANTATVLLSSSLYSLQLILDRDDHEWSSLFSVPLSWFLFHLSVIVEVYSLITAYITFWTKQHVSWQKWDRQGAIEQR
jgi:hypothetical protein